MSKKLETLRDLYIHELRDIYSAEKQITRALPKLAKAANSEELRVAFQDHLKQTQEQIVRIERIFQRLQISSSGAKCKGMEGLLAEGDEFMEKGFAPHVFDAGLIVAAQKVEHYEIAAYGSLCTFAKILGCEEDLDLLKETISEEEATDGRLTDLADIINMQADQTQSNLESDEFEESGSPKKSGSASRYG